jgi:diguanylate cyclase (GGDEF)-like protein/PAS domain S-box-containing protein
MKCLCIDWDAHGVPLRGKARMDKTSSSPLGTSERERYGLLLQLVDHLDAMLAYWDINRVCVFANAAYRDWFGRSKEEMIGITMQQLLGPLYEKNLRYIDAAFAGEKQIFERDIPVPGGSIRSSLATYFPHVVDGQVRGIFVHVADVTPLKKLERQLQLAKERAEALATQDFLTGLPNRARLDGAVDEAMARAQRTHGMFALLTIDIDHFKSINDTYGHIEGDRFLLEMAARIRGAIRESDMALRIGGDEFIVLMAGGDSPASFEEGAKRLLEAAREPFRVGDTCVLPSLSIGIAIYPQHGEDLEAILLASDKALYAAKAAGRGQFMIDFVRQ